MQPEEQSERSRTGGARVKLPPPTTGILLVANIVVWLAVTVTGGHTSPLTPLLALEPNERCLYNGSLYLQLGEAQCQSLGGLWYPGVAGGAWWQLLTNAFTHVEFAHIGLNMLALLILGPQLERALGWRRMLALYLLSALSASVAVYLIAPLNLSTFGASGAVFGMMGALALLVARFGGDILAVALWVAANIAATFLISGISWQGHLGGMAGGVLMTIPVVLGRQESAGRRQTATMVALAGALVALALARTITLAQP